MRDILSRPTLPVYFAQIVREHKPLPAAPQQNFFVSHRIPLLAIAGAAIVLVIIIVFVVLRMRRKKFYNSKHRYEA